MTDLVLKTVPILVLISHIALGAIFLAILFRSGWGRGASLWVGKNSIRLGFVVALTAVLGSLFYSSVVGYPPCILCWWQRVFLFPLVVIFAVSLWKKKSDVYTYAVPLAIIAGLIAAYHAYTNLGGASVLPCTAEGGECSRLYVMAFGYITIPMMSLTIALYILILAWAKKIYENNSHA